MIVTELKREDRDGSTTLSAVACPQTSPATRLNPFFRFTPGIGRIANFGDPFVAALVVPSMYLGEPLCVEAPVSRRLLDGIDEIQSILTAWYPSLRRIEVSSQAPAAQTNLPEQAKGVGCFFSGGADAWYTLLKHQAETSHLFLVRGFDIAVDAKDEVWAQTTRNVHSIGERLGKKIVEVQTNIRALVDMRRVTWAPQYRGDFFGEVLHGSSLAAIALALQGTLARMYVGATYSYDHLAPWGSHPLLDPLWSTESLQVVHDGAEANRMQKIKRIAESDLALASLRVCFENRDGSYNCCRCEKCVRTMMALRACGALHRATAFDRPLDLAQAVRVLYDEHVHPWYRAILPDAQAAGDVELVRALQAILGERFSLEQSFAKLRHRLRGLMPAAVRPALSFIASRQRWRARLKRVTTDTRNPQTV